jgi:hypothetical protein
MISLSLLARPVMDGRRLTLWGRTPGRSRLGAKAIFLAAAVVAGVGCNRGKTQPTPAERASLSAPAAPAPAASSDPEAHIFEKTAWLDSCMKSCRRNVPGRLPSLPAADRERHCTISCACGLAHMTDPGPGPGQVHAPSVRWQSETDDQHRAGVKDCLDRATAEVAASHAHPG